LDSQNTLLDKNNAENELEDNAQTDNLLNTITDFNLVGNLPEPGYAKKLNLQEE